MRRLLSLAVLLALAGCDSLSITSGDTAGQYGNVFWSEARQEAVLVGPDGVALFDPASGDVRRVSREFESYGEVRVAVSPDGRFAYTEAPMPGDDLNRDTRHIWRTDLDSGERTLAVEAASNHLISPDGETLYVTRSRRTDSTFAVPLAGGERRTVGAGWPAALSPDGRQILLARSFRGGVFIHDLQTGAETPTDLVEQDVIEQEEVQWVPEGLFVLRIGRVPDGEANAGHTRFSIVNVLEPSETVLREGPEEASYRYPRWAWRPGRRDAIVSTSECRGTIFYPTCGARVKTLRYVSPDEDRVLDERIGPLSDAVITESGLFVYVRYDERAGAYEPAAVPMRDLGAPE